MEIYKEFTFEAAHRLPQTPPGHKCQRLHGHSFRVRLYVKGPVVEPQGWVMDFAELTQAWKPLFDLVDHRYLNEVEGLENPTSEVLAQWLWQRLQGPLPSLSRVVVSETCTSGAEYDGHAR